MYDFDTTKLAVNTLDVGLAGIEVYDILRDFTIFRPSSGDLGNLLAYVSVGDRERDLERLVAASRTFAAATSATRRRSCGREYISPQVVAARRRRSTRQEGHAARGSRSDASAQSLSCAIRLAS